MATKNKLNPISIFKQYYWIIVIIAIISFLFYWLWEVWLPFFLSLIMAYLLNPFVNFFEKKGFTRTSSVGIVYALITFSLVLASIFLFPHVSEEVLALKHQLPKYIEIARQNITGLETKIQGSHPYFQNIDITGNLVHQSSNMVHRLFSNIPKVLENIVMLIILCVLVPLVTFFFLRDGYEIKKSFIELMPNKYFEMIFGLIFRLEKQLGNYIKGKLLQTAILSTLVCTGLMIIGTPYAIFLGTFAGITHLVPYIGPIIGITPAFIVVFLTHKSFVALIPVAILFLLEQVSDHVFINPFIVGKSINMHPLVVVLSLSIGGYAAGVWGMLLGVPIAGMLQVIIQEFAKEIKFRLYSDKIETDRIELYDPHAH